MTQAPALHPLAERRFTGRRAALDAIAQALDQQLSHVRPVRIELRLADTAPSSTRPRTHACTPCCSSTASRTWRCRCAPWAARWTWHRASTCCACWVRQLRRLATPAPRCRRRRGGASRRARGRPAGADPRRGSRRTAPRPARCAGRPGRARRHRARPACDGACPGRARPAAALAAGQPQSPRGPGPAPAGAMPLRPTQPRRCHPARGHLRPEGRVVRARAAQRPRRSVSNSAPLRIEHGPDGFTLHAPRSAADPSHPGRALPVLWVEIHTSTD